MKLKCKTEKLKSSLALAEKMTGKNLSLPALHAVLLVVSGSSLKLRSTNLGVGIEIEVPCEVQKEGTALIKGDIFLSVINNILNNQDISLDLDNNNLVVQTKDTKTVIKCIDQEDFPTLPIVEGQKFSIKTSILKEGIRSVYFCASVTEIKPEISSIFIYTENNEIIFVATDSFRLAEKRFKVKDIIEIPKILIPYKNISEVLRVLDYIEDDAILVFSRNQISISDKNIYFTSRLIDGAFPDYKLIVPKEEKTKVVLMKQEILSAIRLANTFTDKFFQISLVVDIEQKAVLLN